MATQTLSNIFGKKGAEGAHLKRKKSGLRVATARDYTYTVQLDCEEGQTSQLVYVLRGDTGYYDEDWCGMPLQGALVYQGDLTVDIGVPVDGWIYNGTDDSGVYGYHFSKDVVPEAGNYTVLIGPEYVPGQEWIPDMGFIADRTAP